MLIRAGIIGAGGVGSLHVDALRRLGVAVAGVAAVSPEIARQDAERLGIDEAFDSGVELIASDQVDVVHVCTPNALHFPLCRAALDAGKHVIAEKPLCTSASEAEELLHLAEQAGVVHALCHGYRYYPMIEAFRELVAREELGVIHTVVGAWLNEELLTIDPGHWMLDPSLMGASLSLADVGIHWWDLVEHVVAAPIEEVFCERRVMRANASKGEDTAMLLMRLEGGALANATVCQVAPGHGNTLMLEIAGDRATASWDIRSPDLLTVAELGGGRRLIERGTAPAHALGVNTRLPPGQPEGHSEALLNLFARVYRHIDGEMVNHPTFVDGVRGLRLLEAFNKSASAESWVKVNPPQPARR
jgi:predicted dehydrogenase